MDETADEVSADANARPPDALEEGLAPGRRKDGRARIRVSRACDLCKRRKTRCSGKWPCNLCSQRKLDCQFTASYRRGQVPPIDMDPDASRLESETPSPTVSRSADRLSSYDGATFALEPTPKPQHRSLLPSIEPRTSATAETNTPKTTNVSLVSASLRNSPEASQTDQQGHFVGPASGVSFLLRVKHKLEQQDVRSSDASIFTFGDLPLPTSDSSNFVILPPKTQADFMVRRYFDFASATHRYLHRPTIEEWLEELYETNGSMREQETACSKRALLFMVFAHSTNYHNMHSADPHGSIREATKSSARFFSVAEQQLAAERGKIRLTSVQARLAQCFYLLAHSRLNHCWSLFGTTAHLVLALGMHRKSRVNMKNPTSIDYIDLECRKRTFWCAYSLNTYLSAILGRPMTFHDEDIDQEMPICVDDIDLHRRQLAPPVSRERSILSAPVAHHELSKIIARILREIYGINPPSTSKHLELAAKFTTELNTLRDSMSYLLDTEGDSGIFVKIVLRQRDNLKLAFYHAKILIYRPFLLKQFTSLPKDNGEDPLPAWTKSAIDQNVQHCLDAAVKCVKLVDEIDSAGEFFSTLFLIPYHGFSAAAVLYVYAFQRRTHSPNKYTSYFQAASKCHLQIQRVATKGTMMERYGLVLGELRSELLRANKHLANVATPQIGEQPPNLPMPVSGMHITNILNPPAQKFGPLEQSQSLSFANEGSIPPAYRFGHLTGSGINDDILMPSVRDKNNTLQTPGSDFIDSPHQNTDIDNALMSGWAQFDSMIAGGFLPDDFTDGWDLSSGLGLGL